MNNSLFFCPNFFFVLIRADEVFLNKYETFPLHQVLSSKSFSRCMQGLKISSCCLIVAKEGL